MEREQKNEQVEAVYEELSLVEVEDRLAFANSARCDVQVS